jgi:UDPglucose--hexose-1-phosphate uridylyltransferase
MSFLEDTSHRRLNPLTNEWVLVSPQRAARPWQGQVERPRSAPIPAYDPTCYLCPGNARAGGVRNPAYKGTFAFDNDFPALLAEVTGDRIDVDGLLVARPEAGACRVLCFTPAHDRALSRLRTEEIVAVIRAWQEEYTALGARRAVHAVQIFENRGEMMGASNPHPHGQIWATASVPTELAKEHAVFEAVKRAEDCVLCRYLAIEREREARIVTANDHFVVLVPFWAIWPFEVLVVPTEHKSGIDVIDKAQVRAFAEILSRLTIRYDNVFQSPFPYSMGIHQRPTDDASHEGWHFHLHFYPPLLRSATVRKFMVGFELLAEPQRDITPEAAAERLRSVEARHYLDEDGR